jgi:hypothetical protein
VYRPGLFPDDFPFPLTQPAVRGGVAIVHPDFDPERLAHDLAVIEVPKGSFAGVTPIGLPERGLVNRLRRHHPLRLVGYGADPERGDEAPAFVLEGYRQTRLTSLHRATHRQIALKAGPCFGDSGSPQLLAGSEVAISTFSDPGPNCEGPWVSQRLDTRAERRFLARFVRLP